MTVVVADTSPLNYLILIGHIEVLHRLYKRVLVPREVLEELRDIGAPSSVADWLRSQPEWLVVKALGAQTIEPAMRRLGPGKAAAILLADRESDVLLLIDDADARAEADRRGIRSTGTLGVLRTAAIHRMLDLPTALIRLTNTNFRVSPI